MLQVTHTECLSYRQVQASTRKSPNQSTAMRFAFIHLPFTLIQEGSGPQLLDSVQSKLA